MDANTPAPGSNEETGKPPLFIKPFTVKTKRKRVPYTFKNFTSGRQGKNLFSDAGGALEDKSRLFDEIEFRLLELQEELASLKENRGVIANGGTDVFLIPIEFLTIDPAWCRERPVDWNHVAEIVVNFSEGSLALPTVTLRKVFAPDGKLLEVVISLTDGVHRTAALKELGYTHVRALVHIVNDSKDEAQAYSDNNYNRRAHAKWDIVKVRKTLDDPSIVKIKEIMEDYGFLFPEKAKDDKWPKIGAIHTVEKCYNRYGEDILRRAFYLLSRKEFSTWYGQQLSVSGNFIGGLCRYIDEFEKPGYVHSSLTEHIMATNIPQAIDQTANLLSNPEVVDIFGYSPFQKVDSGRDGEGARIARICAAFVHKVREMFKPSKAGLRPTNYHTKFKEALDVYYDKTRDDRDRADAIGAVRRALARRKMPDCWFTESDIVR